MALRSTAVVVGGGLLAIVSAFSLAFVLSGQDEVRSSARQAAPAPDLPDDVRVHDHAHHATELGEEAYRDAPADLVLWGDLARAHVVRKGSRYQVSFLPPLPALDGRTVSLIGHVTPLGQETGAGKQFLLSAHAFLCHGCKPPAATELVEVNTRDAVSVHAGVATVRGQFALVRDDPDGLVYRLRDAVILQQHAH